ncbi:triosephosphate isomerase [Schizothecium vesticola]|uniref:Triosephosphate isomerase n=1 Tax=Schizothecium vesticola TaxID=314040 RepID=A0AA40K2G0_9PEZI|nr:triosephosphate isomerase [Schizothecium vesticola]
MANPRPHRRRLVGVSTKMYFSAARTASYLTSLLDLLAQHQGPELTSLDIFFIPDLLTVAPSAARLSSSSVLLGAQDCAPHPHGPYTGEVSPAVLAELGVRFVELGHAERRRLFGETDADVAAKAAAVVACGMVPLVCVGEVDRRGVDEAVDEVMAQVRGVLEAVGGEAEVVLAYEPVWAIGAEAPAGVEHVVGVVGRVRGSREVEGRKGGVRIVYGGSAGPGLFGRLGGEVDGLFLGRFAHEPEQFYKTICEVAEGGGEGE